MAKAMAKHLLKERFDVVQTLEGSRDGFDAYELRLDGETYVRVENPDLARLLAASPKMLATLIELLDENRFGMSLPEDIVDEIKEIIAYVEGDHVDPATEEEDDESDY